MKLWRLLTVLISDEGDRVELTVWGRPTNSSSDLQNLILSSGIFDSAFLCPAHAVACFITAKLHVESQDLIYGFSHFLPESIAADSDIIALVFQYLGIFWVVEWRSEGGSDETSEDN